MHAASAIQSPRHLLEFLRRRLRRRERCSRSALSVLVQPQPAHHCRHPRLHCHRLRHHPPPPPPPLPPRLALLSSTHPPELLLGLDVGGVNLVAGAGARLGEGVGGADSGAVGVHAGVGNSQLVGGLRSMPIALPHTRRAPPPPRLRPRLARHLHRCVAPFHPLLPSLPGLHCRACPSPPPPAAAAQREAKESERLKSFLVEIGRVNRRRSSVGITPADAPPHGQSYLLGSAFDYLVEEEVEAVVARALRRPSTNGGASAPAPLGVEVVEAVGERGGSWLRDYVDRLASSASSSFSSLCFSGRHFNTAAISGRDSWDLGIFEEYALSVNSCQRPLDGGPYMHN